MPLAKFPVTRGRTSTTAGLAIVEREVKLAGNDLHDFQILRDMNMPGGQIESSFPRTDVGQINLRSNIRWLQAMDHALWPAHPDLRFSETGGIDLQIVRKIVELDGNLYFDLGDRIARHHQPQADGEQQGNQLEYDIVTESALEKAALQEVSHRQSSLPESCLRESCELGGSSSIKLSSTGLGSVAVGA